MNHLPHLRTARSGLQPDVNCRENIRSAMSEGGEATQFAMGELCNRLSSSTWSSDCGIFDMHGENAGTAGFRVQGLHRARRTLSIVAAIRAPVAVTSAETQVAQST
jgi:hypothetical protein